MRIVSGKYRGKKLKDFDLDTTKPTLDRVKEAMFNLIQFDVVGAVVLDLFSGTGALGVEAISRGAEKTILVDSNVKAIKIINENLKTIEGNFKVYHEDYLTFLSKCEDKFDIVILDPPYKTDYGVKAIDVLNKRNMLNKNAIILFETADEMFLDLDIEGFEIFKKKYGTVAVFKLVKKD